jgi:hypothetical protein
MRRKKPPLSTKPGKFKEAVSRKILMGYSTLAKGEQNK